jgi:hypothetical protein
MLTWVENNNNKIPSTKAAKGTEERERGQWWNNAKSPKKDYVEKYPGVRAVLFGASAAQKKIEADYNKTLRKREKHSDDEVPSPVQLLTKRKKTSKKSKKRKRTDMGSQQAKKRKTPQAPPNAYGVRQYGPQAVEN